MSMRGGCAPHIRHVLRHQRPIFLKQNLLDADDLAHEEYRG